MKISILAFDGSPLGVSLSTMRGNDPAQVGVGGAELAVLTFCEILAKAGHDVTFYNNPRIHDDEAQFKQKNVSEFVPSEERDFVIFFRSPNPLADAPDLKGKKIWFSCDQYTVGSFSDFAPKMDKIVVISPFHAQYFRDTYHIENTIVIDLPCRTWEYEGPIEKVPGRCIFTSVPDRGLHHLLDVWPDIVRRVPEASLVITSDYRLWGVPDAGNSQYVQRVLGMKGVQFLGAVPRSRLVEEQKKAVVLSFCCDYAELFCFAIAEAQLAGAVPVTSDVGACGTTNMGVVIPGNPSDLHWKEIFVDKVCYVLENPPQFLGWPPYILALNRFSPDRILEQWMTNVFA